MDWALAIERNHGALVRLVNAIFAVVGIVPGGEPVSSMPKSVRALVIRVLRPAESALRRLIYMASLGLVVTLSAKRSRPSGTLPKGQRSKNRIPAFQLFDPRKWHPELAKTRRGKRGVEPRISSFDDDSWTPHPDKPAPAEPNPESLCRRLQALNKALRDIPAQARRLARLQARRRAANEPTKRTEPLRPAFPPGHRKHQTHAVDEVLSDCDLMARMEPKPPDIRAMFAALT